MLLSGKQLYLWEENRTQWPDSWVTWLWLCHWFAECPWASQLTFLDLISLSLNWERWNMICNLPFSSSILTYLSNEVARGFLLQGLSFCYNCHLLWSLAQWPDWKYELFDSFLALALIYIPWISISCFSLLLVPLFSKSFRRFLLNCCLCWHLTSH